MVLDIARRWNGNTPHTDGIVKHACRTLLKQGHPEILALYGLDSGSLHVSELQIKDKKIRFGEYVSFSFLIENRQEKEQLVRIEYAIHYMKANGKLAPKVFKISERIYTPFEKNTVMRKHSFRLITTRKFYPGMHRISVIINGHEKADGSFILSE